MGGLSQGTSTVKTCTRCARSDGEVKFRVERKKSGSTFTRGVCTRCRSARSRASILAWHKRHPKRLVAANRRFRRSRWDKVNLIKAGTPCMDCKGIFPAFVMDFDHRDPATKKGLISVIARSSTWEAVEAEIAKCDLVCVNCHRLRTHGAECQDTNPSRRRNYERLMGLKKGPCQDCRGQFKPAQMDFDHVRGRKIAPVSQLTGSAWHKVQEELTKCDLVCANCHRVRTEDRS